MRLPMFYLLNNNSARDDFTSILGMVIKLWLRKILCNSIAARNPWENFAQYMYQVKLESDTIQPNDQGKENAAN
jgi:hypothetical protein